MLNAAMHNAWYLSRHAGGTLPLIDFIRTVTMAYLTSHGTPERGGGRPSYGPTATVARDYARYDHLDHFIRLTDNQRRRCQIEDCTTRIQTECCKCKVGLCIHCFASYHQKVI